MEPQNRLAPAAIRRALIDFAALPIIAFWALLSFGPFVGLVRISEPFRYAVNVLFLLTSLWGVLAGAVFLKSLMWRGAAFGDGSTSYRLWFAIGGAVWCAAYLVFIQTSF
jgi:hypothetical protein